VDAPFVSGAGDAPRLTSSIVVALYDRDSGRALHVHTVHVHEGARPVETSEAVEQAQRHAQTLGHDIDGLGIAVSTEARHVALPHRIDPRTGAFEPAEPPRRAE